VTFPSLIPSFRAFTPGVYPHTSFRSLDGFEGRVRHSNVMVASALRLEFVGLSELDMLSILQHYQDAQGIFLSFSISSEVFIGLATITDFVLTGYSWRYATPPTVLDLPCDRYTVEVELESVESKAALISVGLRGRIGLGLIGGTAAAANGIDAEIVLALDAGGFGAAGITESISLAFADNGASGESFVNGIDKPIALGLAGANASGSVDVSGLSSEVQVSLDPGAAEVIIFTSGFTETIGVSFAGGVADGGDVSPVIEGFAIAPIVFDTAEWEYSELGFAPLATLEPSPSLQLELAAVELL